MRRKAGLLLREAEAPRSPWTLDIIGGDTSPSTALTVDTALSPGPAQQLEPEPPAGPVIP